VSAILSSAFLPSSGIPVGDANHGFTESPTIEEYVGTYFEETPLLAKVAWCESRNRQFTKNGDIFRGKVNNRDVGVMQINEYYHGKRAEELGYDLYSLDGNLTYAKYLFEKEGVAPWKASSKCWNKSSK